jgi:hypothetical protein
MGTADRELRDQKKQRLFDNSFHGGCLYANSLTSFSLSFLCGLICNEKKNRHQVSIETLQKIFFKLIEIISN